MACAIMIIYAALARAYSTYVRILHSSYQCVWVKEAYNVGMWYLQVGKDDNNQCILVLAKHFCVFLF